ncbi:MAG: aspartate-semialdehyde dehydrogenase, partial [Bacteroidota bacterium]
MKVAVVGATGMVGEVMLNVLAERDFPISELLLVASERSVGKKLSYKGKMYSVIGLETAVAAQPDIAIFSAGGGTSLEWAPRFAENGTTVIDNSSAWRMDPTKKLVVPEINADVLTAEDKIIANPNCSTIQMVMALFPLHKRYQMRRVVVSTYQSVSGTGIKAVQQLENETA